MLERVHMLAAITLNSWTSGTVVETGCLSSLLSIFVPVKLPIAGAWRTCQKTDTVG